MARPKKNIRRDADSATVRRFFERSLQLREEQQDVSTLISALNTEMSDAGVDPGVLSLCRRVSALPSGKRGLMIALTRFYFDILEDLLSDDQVDVNDLIRKAKQREMESVAPEPAGNGAQQKAKTQVSKGDAKAALAAAQDHLGTADEDKLPPAA